MNASSETISIILVEVPGFPHETFLLSEGPWTVLEATNLIRSKHGFSQGRIVGLDGSNLRDGKKLEVIHIDKPSYLWSHAPSVMPTVGLTETVVDSKVAYIALRLTVESTVGKNKYRGYNRTGDIVKAEPAGIAFAISSTEIIVSSKTVCYYDTYCDDTPTFLHQLGLIPKLDTNNPNIIPLEEIIVVNDTISLNIDQKDDNDETHHFRIYTIAETHSKDRTFPHFVEICSEADLPSLMDNTQPAISVLKLNPAVLDNRYEVPVSSTECYQTLQARLMHYTSWHPKKENDRRCHHKSDCCECFLYKPNYNRFYDVAAASSMDMVATGENAIQINKTEESSTLSTQPVIHIFGDRINNSDDGGAGYFTSNGKLIGIHHENDTDSLSISQLQSCHSSRSFSVGFVLCRLQSFQNWQARIDKECTSY